MISPRLDKRSVLRSGIRACAFACFWLCLPAIPLSADTLTSNASSIVVDYEGAELDGRANMLMLTAVRITQPGGYVIVADEARTKNPDDFKNSQWTLTGKVHITTPDGASAADMAVISLVSNKISQVEMTGGPATFTAHDPQQQRVAEGHAGKIIYDLNTNIVSLSGDAWLASGESQQLTGEDVTYDVVQRKATVKRGRITIDPSTTPIAAKKSDAPTAGRNATSQ